MRPPYTLLATAYDAFCSAEPFITRFSRITDSSAPPNPTLLDLCCGTGQFAISCAQNGYLVSAIDRSAEMLAVARSSPGANRVNWQCGDIRDLPAIGDLGAITCNFDSLNYFLDLRTISNLFRSVCHALAPGGLFVFDAITRISILSTPASRRFQTEDLEIVLSSNIDTETACRYSIFECFDTVSEAFLGMEIHVQKGYEISEIVPRLKECGLDVLSITPIEWGIPEGSQKAVTALQYACRKLSFDTHLVC